MGKSGYDDMVKEQSAGAVVYRETEDGERLFLLLQPAPGKPWGFPKGKLDRGETVEAAARREIAEETGLTAITLDPEFRHAIQYLFHRGRTVVTKDVTYFLAHTDSTAVRISHEHTAFRWASLDDSMELVIFDNARETLRRVAAHLSVTD